VWAVFTVLETRYSLGIGREASMRNFIVAATIGLGVVSACVSTQEMPLAPNEVRGTRA
jgi:hypothetical protein